MPGTNEAERIARALGLQPLQPEGGLYRRTWAAPPAAPGGRPAATAIYYMLQAGECSHPHRLDTDEIYHFYTGHPVQLLLLGPDGAGRLALLGPDIAAGQTPQLVVPAGTWQGARLLPGGAWALLGTTMAPGYAGAGYTHGNAAALAAEYPAWRQLIAALAGEDPKAQTGCDTE